MTYFLISLPFLIAAVVINRGRWPKATAITVATLLLLTAVFDNLMIAAGLVGYGESQRLGLSIGLAPIEDFFYALAVALIVPAVRR
ncbi:lycopene cyclase domain-containing protein [Corynebacterium gerontici]|uniref:Lycopene cyclase domain-containing protein n=1 Tax=Corynebacterium gerontici TaxID=2079234 RepID=A0A3G6IXN3_9CORY|nr:lycopene cyclase domain-containing protein [Corynebacterium gerontici]AZA10529.1 hypothetical protein CGERO_00970 [Corynebacterium gerontici]